MSDLMRGPGWWLASDGKWYPPELRERTSEALVSPEGSSTPQGEGWWFASDGKWYPPALHPDVLKAASASAPSASPPPSASIARPGSERSGDRSPFRSGGRPLLRSGGRSPVDSRGDRPVRSLDRPPEPPRARPGTRMGQDEASLFRRYVGFVPELGPDPEIRPALREPLPTPAVVGTGAEEAKTDDVREPAETPIAPSPSASSEDELFDIEWGDWDAWEASKPDDLPAQPRGPRHAKGRRWLR